MCPYNESKELLLGGYVLLCVMLCECMLLFCGSLISILIFNLLFNILYYYL